LKSVSVEAQRLIVIADSRKQQNIEKDVSFGPEQCRRIQAFECLSKSGHILILKKWKYGQKVEDIIKNSDVVKRSVMVFVPFQLHFSLAAVTHRYSQYL
jgi:hypothetical protein